MRFDYVCAFACSNCCGAITSFRFDPEVFLRMGSLSDSLLKPIMVLEHVNLTEIVSK